jgi:DNA-binding CsgD family transcriptional regulator
MEAMMENVLGMKREQDLREEGERIKILLRRRDKDLLITTTRLNSEIRERKKLQEENTRLVRDLDRKLQDLHEAQTALRVVMEQRHKEKADIEERMVYNLREITLPYVERLRKRVTDSDCRIYLDIIETNITKVMRPLIHTRIPQRPDLTPTEIKVATMIAEGRTSKEVSSLLAISESGIEYHRNNIRRKLGIQNQRVNLRKYLSSLLSAETHSEHDVRGVDTQCAQQDSNVRPLDP